MTPMTIVGIGASAGGLEALQGLFSAMPTDSGIAFVVITHLAPERKSAMAEILGRTTRMPVSDAQDGTVVQPDHVYVIPSDRTLTIQGQRLQVLPLVPERTPRHPVDVFLGSLAEEAGETAVAIILSGSGTDGTLGVKAIKERGGLTIAQGPDHAPPRHSGMPDSAIASGLVDLVLSVEQMPQALEAHRRGAHDLAALVASEGDGQARNAHVDAGRLAICEVLRERTGHDFSGYKASTFLRRVHRRMQAIQAPDVTAYAVQLRQEPDEAPRLFRDLLIGVTSFFRDAAAFSALEQVVLPRLFEGKGPGDKLRVWVPGCATGEEAYSLAILLREHVDAFGKGPEIKVFASDLDENALQVARQGRYPGALLDALSPERLRQHFTEANGSYAVAQAVRDLCVFSTHSLVRDPPLSRIDLISCRNLLIYLDAETQQRVIPIFHYALRPDGFLFLGVAENASQHTDLFSPLDRKQRIFQRRNDVAPPAHLALFIPGSRQASAMEPPMRQPGPKLRRIVEAHVAEHFAPAHVVVNRTGELVHFSAGTGDYLEAPVGQPSRQLLAMARKPLRLDLRAALHQAVETGRRTCRERITVAVGRAPQLVDIVVEPLRDQDGDGLFLVLFNPVGPPLNGDAVASGAMAEDDPQAERVERELRDTRERLQSIIEEHETGVEELKSFNEELVSLNEELQSTNEELETNKEELQSSNEELSTVNAELSRNLELLDQATSDLRNLFDSTQIALVFLDHQLAIRSFTAPAAGLFRLIPSDLGRPLSDITHQLDHAGLDQDLRAVLTGSPLVERRIGRRDGQECYLLRILPYLGGNEVIDGVIVSLIGIDSLVEAERRQEAAIAQLTRRVRQQAAIATFGQEALRAIDLDSLLQRAAAVVAQGLEIEQAKVLELLPGGRQLLIRAGIGWGPNVVGKATLGADSQSPAGFALISGEPVVTEDLSREQRFAIPDVLHEHGIRSAINVIIHGESDPFGVLEVDSTQVRQFSQDDINFMQSCANLVASAIDRISANAKLERALEEKQLLLLELQHRVKNNLQEITALVGIERRKIAEPSARHSLEVLGSRLEALSVIYRQLYLVDHHTEVELGAYLAELTGELFAFHGVDPQAITLEQQLADLRVDLDHALPLGLIACEFLVNSFKHAFAEGHGYIRITLEAIADGAARLILADNGAGLPRAGNSSMGSGLRLISGLVEQVGGELLVRGEGGVTMTIVFPLNRVRVPMP